MTYLKDFLYLIYPEICPVCGKSLFRGEKVICMQCYRHLPRTRFYKDYENPAAKVFWGKAPLNFVYAAFYYNKGNAVQQLIHALKYKGFKNVGIFLGEEMGNEILNISAMHDLDYIIPVPLHPKKKKKRGFNQSEIIAWAISEKVNVPVNNAVIYRNLHTSTQTKKSKYDRWQNVERIFSISKKAAIDGRHLLLVDDVITTGSTMEACIQTLLKNNDVKISVAAGGFTKG